MSLSFFIFIFLPLLEIFVFILVGKEIGGGETFVLTLLTSFIGIALLRDQWTRSGGMRGILGGMTPPGDELSPALHRLLFYLGAILLILPGFLTDAVGILLLFPWGRRIFYRFTKRWFQKNRGFSAFSAGTGSPFSFFFGGSPFFSGAFREDRFNDFNEEDHSFEDRRSFNDTPPPSPAASDDDVIDVDWTVRK